MPSIRRVLPLLGLAALGSHQVIADDQCSCYEQMISDISMDAYTVAKEGGLQFEGLQTISTWLDYDKMTEADTIKNRGLETMYNAYKSNLPDATIYEDAQLPAVYKAMQTFVYTTLPHMIETKKDNCRVFFKDPEGMKMTEDESNYFLEFMSALMHTTSEIFAANLILDATYADKIAATLTDETNRASYVAATDGSASYLMMYDVLATLIDALTYEDLHKFTKSAISALLVFEKKLGGDLNTLPWDSSVAVENAWETNHKATFKKTLHTIAKFAGNKDLLPFDFADANQDISYDAGVIEAKAAEKGADLKTTLLSVMTDEEKAAFRAAMGEFMVSDAVTNFWGKNQADVANMKATNEPSYWFFEALGTLVDDPAFVKLDKMVFPALKKILKFKLGTKKDYPGKIAGYAAASAIKGKKQTALGMSLNEAVAASMKGMDAELVPVVMDTNFTCGCPPSSGSSAGVSGILVSLGAMAFFLLKN